MTAALRLTGDALRDVALNQGVCVRPVMHEVYDTVTKSTQLIPTPCGATRDSKCPPCAQKNRRLRMQQCREGWHLDEEPERQAAPRDGEDQAVDDEVQQPPERRSGRPVGARTSPTCRGCRWINAPWAGRSRARQGGRTGRACS